MSGQQDFDLPVAKRQRVDLPGQKTSEKTIARLEIILSIQSELIESCLYPITDASRRWGSSLKPPCHLPRYHLARQRSRSRHRSDEVYRPTIYYVD